MGLPDCSMSARSGSGTCGHRLYARRIPDVTIVGEGSGMPVSFRFPVPYSLRNRARGAAGGQRRRVSRTTAKSTSAHPAQPTGRNISFQNIQARKVPSTGSRLLMMAARTGEIRRRDSP